MPSAQVFLSPYPYTPIGYYTSYPPILILKGYYPTYQCHEKVLLVSCSPLACLLVFCQSYVLDVGRYSYKYPIAKGFMHPKLWV